MDYFAGIDASLEIAKVTSFPAAASLPAKYPPTPPVPMP